jgi:hypothetical protein
MSLDMMRLKHYALSTERTYCDWIKRFEKFHHLQDKSALILDRVAKIKAFLSFLALNQSDARSTLTLAL